MKNEKELNKEHLNMRKKGKIPFKVYEALRSTGAQPAKLYGLAKVHKNETPLRPVLSIPGSCYHKLNNFLTHKRLKEQTSKLTPMTHERLWSKQNLKITDKSYH